MPSAPVILVAAAIAIALCHRPVRQQARLTIAQTINRRTGMRTPDALYPRFVVKVRDVTTLATYDLVVRTNNYASRSVYSAAPHLRHHDVVEVIEISPLAA